MYVQTISQNFLLSSNLTNWSFYKFLDIVKICIENGKDVIYFEAIVSASWEGAEQKIVEIHEETQSYGMSKAKLQFYVGSCSTHNKEALR